ncbi:hypothetical protein JCM15765_22670 [Paradesulfitobacterium aromaticivorans]
MKRNVFPLWIVIGLASLLFITIFWQVKSTRADTTYYELNIATNPTSALFTADNMAPGDQVSSFVNVLNTGNLDFNYSVNTNQESGSEALFNSLLLKISDNNGPLFEGFLSELADFPLGTISAGGQAGLSFTASLPKECNNDVQGQSTSVSFVFSAVGHDQDIPVESCFEPPFSNVQFTLHQKSTVPIKFHLHEPSIDNDVRLEVTGPAKDGGTVTYFFRTSDGTLKFDNHLDEPHYLARFSTFDFPVVTNATYIATVYDDSQAVCWKAFVVLEQGNRSNSLQERN